MSVDARIVEMMVARPALLPLIRGWNRLEGRPRTVDFERALRAEVRDPLWFLTRQWQFGEFDGEDAGSPIEARVVTERRALHGYRPRDDAWGPYDPAMPLEAAVEHEPVPFDLVTHRQVTRLLFARLAALPDPDDLKALYRAAYPLDAGKVDGYADADSEDLGRLAFARLVDGRALLAELAGGGHDARVDAFALPQATRDALKIAGAEVRAAFGGLYLQPATAGDGAWDDGAWDKARLEYRFACSLAAPAPGAPEEVLAVREHVDGRLDWFAFDVAGESVAADAAGTAAPAPIREALSFVPAPVTFGGMPNPRYWEMEDRRTEFADITAATTDIAKLMLAEFALVFSNDWCLVPYEVEVGSLTGIPGLVVIDTFGERTLIASAGRGRDEDWQRWSMFTLSTAAAGDTVEPRLFLPPVTPKLMESPPIEKVSFLRDEMANMCWAVEVTIPSASGTPRDGYVVARATAPAPVPPPALPEGVSVRYELGHDVPWNWRPFVPVALAAPGTANLTGEVALRRGRLPGPDRPIRGAVLAQPSPYDIFEAEVPRAGVRVTRSFQRTRWQDGSIRTWLGRRAGTGLGEGSSGLVFDQIRNAVGDRAI